MCRHLAYLGPSVTLQEVICDPPFGLMRQAWAPRRQRHGTVNADGFGVGWYADGDPDPARYRRARPLWADPSFADLARVTRTGALLAAARSATGGTDLGETAAAPYRSGRWLFSHNGVLDGWPDATASLAATLPAARLLALEARCDSALAWALVLRQLDEGRPPADALAATVADLDFHGVTGRFNFLLTDGEVIAATAAGDTLSYSVAPGRTVIASEPDDDGHDWIDVAGRSVLTATAGTVDVRPLTAPWDWQPRPVPDDGRISH